MKLQDIIKHSGQIKTDGYELSNEMIRGADISVIGHFGNLVTLNVWTGCCCLIHDHNNTHNLGVLIKALVELFELDQEDGFNFADLKNIPCRIISKGWGTKVVGFGHFMKDKFVYIDDLALLTE